MATFSIEVSELAEQGYPNNPMTGCETIYDALTRICSGYIRDREKLAGKISILVSPENAAALQALDGQTKEAINAATAAAEALKDK